MPTYEYQCPEGHTFDKFQRMTEKPRAKCPICGRAAVRKISGGAGLVFKGSGFYITDYGKDGKGPRKAPESETKADAGAKDAGSKPESPAKSDAKTDKPSAPKSESKPRSGGGEGKKASGE